MNKTRDTLWDNDEASFNERDRRRFAAEARAIAKMDRLHPKADALIGQLCREGRTVYYINLTDREGRFTGKTKEDTRGNLIDYLIRNKYVH